MEIINIEGGTFRAIMERFEAFANEVETVCGNKGERHLSKWLDTQEVCIILDISKRTLQKLRDNGTLPFTRVENKMYYRPSDLEKLIGSIVNKKHNNG